MTDDRKQKPYAKPMYAAAGAGELAMEQLRKLPETVARLRTRVETGLRSIDLTEVREDLEHLTGRVRSGASQLRTRITAVSRKSGPEVREDVDKARKDAQATLNELVDTAQKQLQVAGKRAVKLYEDLAVRGEKTLAETQDEVKEPKKTVTEVAPAEPKPTARKAVKSTAKRSANGKAAPTSAK